MSRAQSIRVRLILRRLKQMVPAWVRRRPFVTSILVTVLLGLVTMGAFIWERRVYFRPETCNSFAFSPDGDSLAVGYADGVTRLITFNKDGSVSARHLKESIFDPGITTKYVPYIYPAKLWGGWRPAYIMNEEQPSPDGALLARKALDGNWRLQPSSPAGHDTTAESSAITIGGGQGGSEVNTVTPGFGVRWRPDGKQLAILQTVTDAEADPDDSSAPHPSPSKYVAKVPVVKALRLTIWDVAAHRVTTTYDLPCIYCESIMWSRDGSMLGTAELTGRDPLIASNKIGYNLTWWNAATGHRIAGTYIALPPSLNSMFSSKAIGRSGTVFVTSEIRDVVWSPDLDRVAIGINVTPLNRPIAGKLQRFSYMRIIPMPPREPEPAPKKPAPTP